MTNPYLDRLAAGGTFIEFYDPHGARFGLPTYPYRFAPAGLATLRQLRQQCLRPGGQPIAAQILWRKGKRVAYLYRLDLAKPARLATPAQLAAIHRALKARRTCPPAGANSPTTSPAAPANASTAPPEEPMNSLTALRRVRWAVRLTLTLGVAASVAANILHADPNPISQTISAWPPLALLLTVELISRVPVHRRNLAAARLIATAAIAGIAAWVSYWHMAGVTARYGETGPSPYLLPISVDGLIVVASISLVELAGRIRHLETPTPAMTPAPVPAPAIGDTPAPTAQPAARTTPRKTTPAKTTSPAKKTAPAKATKAAKPKTARPTTPATVDNATTATEPVPAHLLPTARFSAVTHQQTTGRNITADELAARLSIGVDTARRLLLALDEEATTPAPTPAGVNGSPRIEAAVT
ncbi:MAG TPA: RRQRL motif-containing zinc-binding protein [Kribbellaceae bacterium]|nr:RRQRL motif-containing zinc-binding protein [Kribbellaceae bacterium]